MKAKDYLTVYRSNPNIDTLSSIIVGIFDEVHDLIRVRGAKNDFALFAILDELNAKYRAFAMMTNDSTVPAEAFEFVTAKQMPEIYSAWMNYKKVLSERKNNKVTL